VQHEGEPLGRVQRLEYDQQRKTHRVGEDALLGRIDPVAGLDDRVGHAHAQRVLAPGSPRAQHVQALPRHDRGEPAGDVVHVLARGARDSQPSLLHRVLGLGERAQHPVGQRLQPGSLLLETLSPELFVLHVSHPLDPAGHFYDTP